VELINTKTKMYEDNILPASEVFDEYGDFIRSVLYAKVKNKDLVDDLFQDFFLSLVYKPMPKGINNTKSYLYKAITNDIVDAVRRTGRYKSHIREYSKQLNYSINEDSLENALMEREELDKLFAIIKERLPDSESQAIFLRYREKHSIKKVAKKMCINDRSVSRYISVGLKKIRQFLTVK